MHHEDSMMSLAVNDTAYLQSLLKSRTSSEQHPETEEVKAEKTPAEAETE